MSDSIKTNDLDSYKDKVFSFPATLLPDMGKLTELFCQKYPPLENLEIFDPIKRHALLKKYYDDCFHAPDKNFYFELEEKYPNPRDRFGKDGKEMNEEILQYLENYFGENRKGPSVKGWIGNKTSIKRNDLLEYFTFNRESIKKKYGLEISATNYFPPGGFREWHTNRDGMPGWRMYYIRVSEEGKSWFHYLDAKTGEFIKVPDQDNYYNLFYISNQSEVESGVRPDYLWHNVVSHTQRRSLGMRLEEAMAQEIVKKLEGKVR